MGKSLIITEKPSVAREFAAVLRVNGRNDGFIENGEYVITWCVGHLVGLVYPESYDIKYKKWKLEDLPFLPEQYKYDVIKEVEKQYNIVNHMLHREDIDRVYWAGDAGKEGQTIEENIRNFGGVRKGMEELRVWIDSQTEEEILRGLKEAKPMSDYMNLGNSGIMRTIEDYAMGINFSRVMSIKYGSLLNNAAATTSYTAIAVGRVMTCVLGMVVIREREIRNFKETPFYRVIIKTTDADIEGEWKSTEGSRYFESPLLYKEIGFKKEDDAKQLIELCTNQKAIIDALEKTTSKKRAPLLFNLAELQAECSKRFKISPDETLQVVQELYEKKLTTYPRTDARVLSSAVAKELFKTLNKLKGYEPTETYVEKIIAEKRYQNIEKTQYIDDSKVTDHYAIIPTGQLTELSKLDKLQTQIFDLITRRFLSIFYPPAEYQNIKMTVLVRNEKFFSSAKILINSGYMEVVGMSEKENSEENDVNIKALIDISEQFKEKDEISVSGFEIKYGKTSPPKRYTSGSMILAMENAGQLIEDEELREQIRGTGIGTSATRAEIIKKLVRIGYLNLNKKTQVLSPHNLGEMIYEVVNMTVPALLNPKMSASWEKGLEGITQGTVEFADYRKKLEDFIRKETISMMEKDLRYALADKISEFADAKGKGVAAHRKIGVKCPICQGEIVTTSFGYGCSNYKTDKTGCNFNIGTIAGKELLEKDVIKLLTEGKTDTLRGFKSKSGKKFDAVLEIIDTEEGNKTIQFNFENVEPEVIEDIVCPQCNSKMVKTSFGFKCSNNKFNDENSCNFSIGTIAGKKISEVNLKQLLKDGRTETIRGFKSKNGKKFDACLKLTMNEKKAMIEFDFENVEARKVKKVVCPLCKGDIVVTSFGYGCSNYKKDEKESCSFVIGKIAGVKLKEAQVVELLSIGKTQEIEGFVAKTGMKFSAALKINEQGEIKFDFPEKPEPIESNVPCPKCQKHMMKTQWRYECECGFSINHTVAKVELSEACLIQLMTDGKTKEPIQNFVSSKGTNFNANLKLENDKIVFDFT